MFAYFEPKKKFFLLKVRLPTLSLLLQNSVIYLLRFLWVTLLLHILHTFIGVNKNIIEIGSFSYNALCFLHSLDVLRVQTFGRSHS